ncbi:MAG TPA: PAS domain S-box protein [Candidatus Paceibacterota bacterium]|nr:PAS domain S-box protein [Candidatus Paceibacterota bacterium]
MQAQKVIERLGYKANEAKVYLAVLHLGEATVSDITSKVKLPRTSVQLVISKLHTNGLVNFYTKRRSKYWSAESPNRLLQKLQDTEEEVRAALPQLEQMRRVRSAKPHVETLEGVEKIKEIYSDILETKQPVSAIIPWDQWIEFVGQSFMDEFIAKRVKQFLRLRLLTLKTAISEKLRTRDVRDLRETRFLPPDVPISSTLFVYGPKVAIVSLNKKQPTAVVIEDPEVSYTNSSFFEEMWGRSAASSSETLNAGSPAVPLEEIALFRVLADSSPQPILIANEQVEIQYVNNAWERQFGFTIAEVYGKNPRMLQSGKTPRELYTRLWKALTEGHSFQTDEVIDERKDGTFFNLLTTIFPVRHRGKLFYVQVLDDISEHKRADSMRRQFMQSASQDIQPHLAFIRTFLSKHAKKIKPVIETEIQNLEDIAKRLLESSE